MFSNIETCFSLIKLIQANPLKDIVNVTEVPVIVKGIVKIFF